MGAQFRQFDNAPKLIDFPLGDSFSEPRRHNLRHGRRHNPLGSFPSANDVIAFRLELGGISNPKTLSHTHTPSNIRNRRSSRLINRDNIVTAQATLPVRGRTIVAASPHTRIET